ncbi:Alpha/Beta hydrolase protein [Aspergillus lucknowensis]|uniref:Carboxylic ester hydrolase n=1 Tax=Aspergillus lucknowensis TaxID=176173 RepID=A0ABR4LWY7_9EURO
MASISYFLAVFSLLSVHFYSSALAFTPTPIDLDYAIHAPTYVNSTASGTRVALYNNIRFAYPPTGNLRFRKPRTPPPHEAGIQDGRDRLYKSDCVSSAPAGIPFPGLNGSTWGQEDCLFLNVYVPEGVRPGIDRVPVVHWIYGSAYAFGSKDLMWDGMPLMDHIRSPEDQFIYVASNYRMGLYGWTSAEDEDMDANVGLHDAIAAVEWTQKYISRFGGDPDNITVMGESAGGNMIALMLVAEGLELPFQKAFLSSPAMLPRRNVTTRRRDVFNQVLKAANCTSLECLRNASPSTLVEANKYLLTEVPGESGGASFGPGIGLGPFPDGHFIPDAMTALFEEGRFNKQVRSVISGNMAAEGLQTTPDVSTAAEFATLVRRLLPGATDRTVQRIRDLYPYPDSEIQAVAVDWTTDAVFACNAQAAARAYADRGHRYVFSVPPATHGLDLNYLFYRSQDQTTMAIEALAREFQSKTLDFIRGQNCASGGGVEDWPVYGKGFSTANITERGFVTAVDPWATRKNCDLIFDLIMDPSNGA